MTAPGKSEVYTDSGMADLLCDLLKTEQRNDGGFLCHRTEHDEYEIPAVLLAHPGVVDMLAEDPGRLMSCLEQAVGQALRINGPLPDGYRPTIRLASYPLTNKIRGLGGDTIGKMVGICGLVSHVGAPAEVPLEAVYRCPDGHTTAVERDSAPNVCSNPDCKHRNLELHESESKWGRAQEITIQELPEDMIRSDVPAAISCVVEGSLVEHVYSGAKVQITGILGTVARNAKTGKGRVRQLWANNLRLLPTTARGESGHDHADAASEVDERLKSLAGPDILGRLTNTLAPHIAGHGRIKEGLVLSLVSVPARPHNQVRWNIHVLIVGDPSTAKTQLLLAAHGLDPSSHYASGKGSSGVGLTAAVVQDTSGTYTLSIGTILCADGSVAYIDELDKIRDEDQSALHEVMESQILHINKGGIRASLPARTGVVGAANPKDGIYNTNLTIRDNINMNPTLLSRFDLVFLVRDEQDPARDGKVADEILRQAAGVGKPSLDAETAAKYISAARRIRPSIQPEASVLLRQYYQDARRSDDEQSVRITPRQLWAVIRIAVSKAKVELRDAVTADDARYAIDLVEHMLDGAARDPATGRIDANILQGARALDSTRLDLVRSIVRNLSRAGGRATRQTVVREMLGACHWPDEDPPMAFLRRCISERHVVETADGLQLPPSL